MVTGSGKTKQEKATCSELRVKYFSAIATPASASRNFSEVAMMVCRAASISTIP